MRGDLKTLRQKILIPKNLSATKAQHYLRNILHGHTERFRGALENALIGVWNRLLKHHAQVVGEADDLGLVLLVLEIDEFV